MKHIAKTISPLNTLVNNYFTAFKTQLVNYSTIEWNNEDLKGKSYAQWQAMQYYNLMYLLIIVYKEIIRTKNLNYTWSYYVNKFKLDTYRKCLECEGIDFDKALHAFGFDTIFSNGGIESMIIEYSFKIESFDLPKSSILVKDLLLVPNQCFNYIN